MSTSTKPKSQPGKNGPEGNNSNSDKIPPLLPPPSLSEKPTPDNSEPDVQVAEDLDNTPEPLTAEEIRISRKMNQSIMNILGLKTRSRSFRV
jgi:hypothetical protein